MAIWGLQVTEPEASSCRRRPAGDELLGRAIGKPRARAMLLAEPSGSTVTNACSRSAIARQHRADRAVAPGDRDEIGVLVSARSQLGVVDRVVGDLVPGFAINEVSASAGVVLVACLRVVQEHDEQGTPPGATGRRADRADLDRQR